MDCFDVAWCTTTMKGSCCWSYFGEKNMFRTKVPLAAFNTTRHLEPIACCPKKSRQVLAPDEIVQIEPHIGSILLVRPCGSGIFLIISGEWRANGNFVSFHLAVHRRQNWKVCHTDRMRIPYTSDFLEQHTLQSDLELFGVGSFCVQNENTHNSHPCLQRGPFGSLTSQFSPKNNCTGRQHVVLIRLKAFVVLLRSPFGSAPHLQGSTKVTSHFWSWSWNNDKHIHKKLLTLTVVLFSASLLFFQWPATLLSFWRGNKTSKSSHSRKQSECNAENRFVLACSKGSWCQTEPVNDCDNNSLYLHMTQMKSDDPDHAPRENLAMRTRPPGGFWRRGAGAAAGDEAVTWSNRSCSRSIADRLKTPEINEPNNLLVVIFYNTKKWVSWSFLCFVDVLIQEPKGRFCLLVAALKSWAEGTSVFVLSLPGCQLLTKFLFLSCLWGLWSHTEIICTQV